jgi:cyclopropane fatty-acyl-phospholipid synthase-like methyltransferase
MSDQKFIDGSHYEEQYADITSEYFKLYVQQGIPWQAVSMNQYYVDLAIMLFDLEPGAKVLEAGCGVGHAMRAWRRRKFNCTGIEVSHSARRYSPYRDSIRPGNIMDMRGIFRKDEFDLVFSHGTMEHIPEEFVGTTIKELKRVGIRQFHIITTDPESSKTDPGHITIHPYPWWLQKFAENSDKTEAVGALPDPLMNELREPIVITVPYALTTHPLRRYFADRMKEKGDPENA